jgi:hypothetical protein
MNTETAVPAPIARLSRVFDVAMFTTDTFGATDYHLAVLRIPHRYGMGEHFDIVRVSQSGIATREGQKATYREAMAEMFDLAAR